MNKSKGRQLKFFMTHELLEKQTKDKTKRFNASISDFNIQPLSKKTKPHIFVASKEDVPLITKLDFNINRNTHFPLPPSKNSKRSLSSNEECKKDQGQKLCLPSKLNTKTEKQKIKERLQFSALERFRSLMSKENQKTQNLFSERGNEMLHQLMNKSARKRAEENTKRSEAEDKYLFSQTESNWNRKQHEKTEHPNLYSDILISAPEQNQIKTLQKAERIFTQPNKIDSVQIPKKSQIYELNQQKFQKKVEAIEFNSIPQISSQSKKENNVITSQQKHEKQILQTPQQEKKISLKQIKEAAATAQNAFQKKQQHKKTKIPLPTAQFDDEIQEVFVSEKEVKAAQLKKDLKDHSQKKDTQNKVSISKKEEIEPVKLVQKQKTSIQQKQIPKQIPKFTPPPQKEINLQQKILTATKKEQKQRQQKDKQQQFTQEEEADEVMEELFYYIDRIQNLGEFKKKSKDIYPQTIPQMKQLSKIEKITSYYISQQFYYYSSMTYEVLSGNLKNQPYFTLSPDEVEEIIKNQVIIDEIEHLEKQLEAGKKLIEKAYKDCKPYLKAEERLLTIDAKANYHLKCCAQILKEFKAVYDFLKQKEEIKGEGGKRCCFLIEIYAILKMLNGEQLKEFQDVQQIQDYFAHINKYKCLMMRED